MIGNSKTIFSLAIVAGMMASQASQGAPLPVQEVASGVFVYEAPVALAGPANDGAIANLGFVVGRDAVAVIDSGGSRKVGERLFEAVREKTSLPIRYVINTHVHPDHVLGNAAFREHGVQFVGHRHLPEALAGRASSYLASNRALVGEAFDGTEIIAPSILVEAELELDLGERTLRIEAWPTAHTNTDLTVRDLVTDTWFLGDLLFTSHVPAVDGRILGWLNTLRTLCTRSAARVVPGHGPASMSWPEAAQPIERYLSRLERDVRQMIGEGRTLQDAAKEAGRSEAHNWTLFDEFNARNATTVFQELEWN